MTTSGRPLPVSDMSRIVASVRVIRRRRIPVIYDSRSASCVRDLTSSFRNALRRWYSTVLALMNRRAAISRFVSPCAARRATCVSWGVNSSRVSVVRRQARSPVASSSSRALREGLDSGVSEELVGSSQLRASIETAPLTSKPLAVQQLGAGELHADARSIEPGDCVLEELIGVIAIAEQCAETSLDSQTPVGA